MLRSNRVSGCKSSRAGNWMEERFDYWDIRILYICLWVSNIGHFSRVFHDFLMGYGLYGGCSGWIGWGTALDCTGTPKFGCMNAEVYLYGLYARTTNRVDALANMPRYMPSVLGCLSAK
jgi:hypothetical protein